MNISKRTRLALLVCFISLSSTVNAHSRAHIHIYESATEQTDAEKSRGLSITFKAASSMKR